MKERLHLGNVQYFGVFCIKKLFYPQNNLANLVFWLFVNLFIKLKPGRDVTRQDVSEWVELDVLQLEADVNIVRDADSSWRQKNIDLIIHY